MGTLSIWHWLILVIFASLAVWPFWRITQRTGNPPVMSFMVLVPGLNILFIFYLALGRWPALDGGSSR